MKKIYSQKCAGFLMMNGCRLVRLEVNLKEPRKHVFIFQESDELTKLLGRYTENQNRKHIYNKQSI